MSRMTKLLGMPRTSKTVLAPKKRMVSNHVHMENLGRAGTVPNTGIKLSQNRTRGRSCYIESLRTKSEPENTHNKQFQQNWAKVI